MFRLIIDQLEQEYFRHFLWVPILLSLGIGTYFSLPFEPPYFMTHIALIVAGLVSGVVWHRARRLYLALPLIIVVGGFATAQFSSWRVESPMLSKDLGFRSLIGTVADMEQLPEGRRLWLTGLHIEGLSDASTPAKIRLTDRKAATPLTIGQKIEAKAFLRAITEPILPGGYDFRRHALFSGIGATGFIIGDIKVEEAKSHSSGFADARLIVQQKVSQFLSGDQAAIAVALLTGSQQGISESTMEEMRLSGLTHILSVSGLHIGLAAGIFFFLIRGLLALFPSVALHHPIKKWAAALSWFGALTYTLFVGAPVPAVRSLLMITLALLAIIVDRTALSLRVVALSASLILLVVPQALLTPSFQLSFAAITAIIGLYEIIERQRGDLMAGAGFIKRGFIALCMIAITSVAASFATAPFTHYHFQQLQGYGVLSNMLAIPLTSFWIMPAAIASFALMPFGWEQWPLYLLGHGINSLQQIAKGAANLPGAGWQPPALPFAALICLTLGGLWLLIWQMRWRWLGLLPLICGIGLAFMPERPLAIVSSDGRYTVAKTSTGYVLISDTSRRKEDAFVPEEWRQWLGIKSYEPSNDDCRQTQCQMSDLIYVRDPNWLPETCGKNLTVIYPGGRLKECGSKNIDRSLLKREGAVLISDDGTYKTVRQSIGERPWTRYQPKIGQ